MLTRVEEERIRDSRMRIQTVANSLTQVDPMKVPDMEEIQECLDNAEKSLDQALKSADSSRPTAPPKSGE
jgi:hypothetical protein